MTRAPAAAAGGFVVVLVAVVVGVVGCRRDEPATAPASGTAGVVDGGVVDGGVVDGGVAGPNADSGGRAGGNGGIRVQSSTTLSASPSAYATCP